MPIVPILLAAHAASIAPPACACRPQQLRVSLDAGGDFNGMSHSGVALSIRNLGPDCMIPDSPKIELSNARGRTLRATRRTSPGQRGAAMIPLRFYHNSSLRTDLRWVSGPVYPRSRSVRVASVAVKIDGTTVRMPLTAVLYSEEGKTLFFDQTPLRKADGGANR